MSHYASETFLHQLLGKALAAGASDVHLKVGKPPGARVGGELVFFRVDEIQPADTEAAAALIFGAEPRITTDVVRAYEARDASGLIGRFRASAFRQRGSLSIALRRIPGEIPTPAELRLAAAAVALVERRHGLVVIAGGASSGRSTTAASLVAHVNASRAAHVITFEEPIEHLHVDLRGSVAQRSIGADVASLTAGLRSSARHDADLLFAADLRAPGELDAALDAATRALVLAVVTAPDAPSAVGKLAAMSRSIPDGPARLAKSFEGVIAQRLVAATDGAPAALEGRVVSSKACLAEAVRRWPELYAELAAQTFDGSTSGVPPETPPRAR